MGKEMDVMKSEAEPMPRIRLYDALETLDKELGSLEEEFQTVRGKLHSISRPTDSPEPFLIGEEYDNSAPVIRDLMNQVARVTRMTQEMRELYEGLDL